MHKRNYFVVQLLSIPEPELECLLWSLIAKFLPQEAPSMHLLHSGGMKFKRIMFLKLNTLHCNSTVVNFRNNAQQNLDNVNHLQITFMRASQYLFINVLTFFIFKQRPFAKVHHISYFFEIIFQYLWNYENELPRKTFFLNHCWRNFWCVLFTSESLHWHCT